MLEALWVSWLLLYKLPRGDLEIMTGLLEGYLVLLTITKLPYRDLLCRNGHLVFRGYLGLLARKGAPIPIEQRGNGAELSQSQ